MQRMTVPAHILKVGDYILADPIAGEPSGEWSKPKAQCWLVRQIHRSYGILFLTCSGHDEGCTVWYNHPARHFHFTIPEVCHLNILERGPAVGS